MSPPPLLDGWLAVCGLKREAAIWSGAARSGRAVVGGGRSDLLRERLETAIAEERPAGLVSFGVAGALRPDLRIGTVVVGRAVRAPDGRRFDCDADAARRLSRTSGGYVGEVAGSETVAADLAAKQALAPGALAVDMESHVAAAAAEAHGLPLAVVRIISDGAGHRLPPAAVAGMRPDGGIDLGAVLAALARDPRQLPDLLRTGRHAGRAFRKLEEVRAALG